jgi:CubicO group peptidase (beta-lactamase class C family)
MSGPVSVGGTIAEGFEGVHEAFARNFVEHDEVGAACAVYVGGCKVVDLWGGIADVQTGAPYGEDTLQLVFSTTKGLTALCANLLAQRGHLDVDSPVARYWPEFAQAGKDEVTVRSLLSHKAGLPYIEADLTLGQALAWDPVIRALEAQAPIWEPGTAHGYHAITFGWLVGEVIRRITGKSVGAFFADEVAAPLGLDLWIGLPDEHQARVAPLTTHGLQYRPPRVTSEEADETEAFVERTERLVGSASMLIKALGGVSGSFVGSTVFNQPRVRAAEVPSINGVGDARSIARMYAAIIGPVEGATGGPVLTAEQVAAASTCQTSGYDKVLTFPSTFGLGFMTASRYARFGSARGFGHTGAGGSVGFADPERGIAFAYVMNRMLAGMSGDPRSRALVRATYEALGLTPTYS